MSLNLYVPVDSLMMPVTITKNAFAFLKSLIVSTILSLPC